MAAILACGRGAVLSHRSAADHWGLLGTVAANPIDITSPTRAGRSRPGITIHGGARIHPSEVTTRDRIPCTSLPRTLLDLAGVLDQRALERAVDRAETLRVFDLDALQAVLRRNRGRRGRPQLARLLAGYTAPAITRSHAEERFLALVDGAGLVRPRINAWIALPGGTGYEADFLWEAAKLIVEVDGRTHHARRLAFGRDRRRDRTLALAGFETRRYEAAELVEGPERVVSELRAFLARGEAQRTAPRDIRHRSQ